MALVGEERGLAVWDGIGQISPHGGRRIGIGLTMPSYGKNYLYRHLRCHFYLY